MADISRSKTNNKLNHERWLILRALTEISLKETFLFQIGIQHVSR